MGKIEHEWVSANIKEFLISLNDWDIATRQEKCPYF